MFFNRELEVGRATASLASSFVSLAFLMAGCSFHHGLTRAEPPSGASAAPSTQPAAEPETTAAGAAISHPDGVASAVSSGDTGVSAGETSASAAAPLSRDEIKASAPMRYTVRRGDTLWGISNMYLRDPWLWPEIWYDNPQVANPHLIYPGDVLLLAYGVDGRPQLRIERGGVVRLEPSLRSTPLDGAIPTIPYAAISAFLSRPSILSARELARAPHVVAFRDEHQAAGSGEDVYVRGLDAPVGARFTVLHVGEKLRDPDNGRVLGYEALYTATGVIVRPGDPAKLNLLDSARETLRGDILIADNASNPLNFVPRAPSGAVRGRIISVVDSVHLIGQYNIIAINRGTRHGVDAGTVLAVDQRGEVVPDRGAASYDSWGRSDTFAHHVRLPDERAGTVLVFKAFDRMSYALVVAASEQMRINDIVRNP